MPTDRLLVQHLRSLRSSEPADTGRLQSTAVHLLTTLTNPLNLTLLTHHLLTSPALWPNTSLKGAVSFISIFQSAAARITRYEDEKRERKEQRLPIPPPPIGQPVIGGNLAHEEWIRGVIKGADERSPTPRHVLVFAGLLVGFCGQARDVLNRRLRRVLENALVRAVNLALDGVHDGTKRDSASIALALNYTFELLSDLERSRIMYDKLLPVLLGSAFFSEEGYASAAFLQGINADLITQNGRWAWPQQSPSFRLVQDTSQRLLVTTMGPLARLTSHTLTTAEAPWLVQTAVDDLVSFTRTLEEHWRQCKIGETDAAQEKGLLDEQTVASTLPVLWRVLRSTLFAVTIILRGVMSRLLNDRALANDEVAPSIATQTLDALSHLSFILTHHSTPTSFSQHTFVNLTAIDVLTAYPSAAVSFLTSKLPHPSPASPHPHELSRVLFYLNTAEHFALTLNPGQTSSLLLPIATNYLTPPADASHHHLAPRIFEAAHSVLLSALSAPQNSDIASTHLPFYADQLFKLFPASIQPRQFRLAVKTLVRIASPPNDLAVLHPDMAPTLLEVVRYRAFHPETWERRPVPYEGPMSAQRDESPPATLVMALIDCLPALALGVLVEWLPLVAEVLNHPGVLAPGWERDQCKARFWECISSEMDVERAELCVRWWGTMGGRETVVAGGHAEEVDALASGALQGVDSKL